jgi:hypothetical protein
MAMSDYKNGAGNGLGKENQKENVVQFDPRAQKKQKPVQNRAGGSAGYGGAMQKQRNNSSGAPGVKWYHYVQTLILLLGVAWLMKACQI